MKPGLRLRFSRLVNLHSSDFRRFNRQLFLSLAKCYLEHGQAIISPNICNSSRLFCFEIGHGVQQDISGSCKICQLSHFLYI